MENLNSSSQPPPRRSTRGARKSEPRVLLSRARRTLHNQYLCDFDRASRTAQKLPSYRHASLPRKTVFAREKMGDSSSQNGERVISLPCRNDNLVELWLRRLRYFLERFLHVTRMGRSFSKMRSFCLIGTASRLRSRFRYLHKRSLQRRFYCNSL